MPLTFEVLETSDGWNYLEINGDNKNNISYKLNDGEWTPYTTGSDIYMNVGDKISLSANRTYWENQCSEYGGGAFYRYGGSKVKVYGNLHSLINWSNSINTNFCFYKLFGGSGPKASLVDASNLILPATTLTTGCYSQMFKGCSGLITGPKTLPATTVPSSAYAGMFTNCSSLITAPEMAPTSVGAYSCNMMFYGCKSLTGGITTLPATSLPSGAYSNMFYQCSSLLAAPEIMATSMQTNAMYDMFISCKSLSSISVRFTSWNSNALHWWVNGVDQTGTFYCPTALGTQSNIARGMERCPTNFTVVNVD